MFTAPLVAVLTQKDAANPAAPLPITFQLLGYIHVMLAAKMVRDLVPSKSSGKT